MFCRHCGQQNPDEAAHCIKCGAYIVGVEPQHALPQQNPYGAPMHITPPPPGMQKPSNHLALAIISTICCGCLPIGIVSIVFAAQVDSKWNAGDYQGAIDSSNKAKTFAFISFGVGIVFGIISAFSNFSTTRVHRQQNIQFRQNF